MHSVHIFYPFIKYTEFSAVGFEVAAKIPVEVVRKNSLGMHGINRINYPESRIKLDCFALQNVN